MSDFTAPDPNTADCPSGKWSEGEREREKSNEGWHRKIERERERGKRLRKLGGW